MVFVRNYLLIINIVAAILMIYDKVAAGTGRWRIRERTLLLVALAGGAAAMGLMIFLIHHKTRKPRFALGIPVLIVLQLLFFVLGLDQGLTVRHFVSHRTKLTRR